MADCHIYERAIPGALSVVLFERSVHSVGYLPPSFPQVFLSEKTREGFYLSLAVLETKTYSLQARRCHGFSRAVAARVEGGQPKVLPINNLV